MPLAALALAAAALSGCSIVDETLLDTLPSRTADAGTDAGAPEATAVDRCGLASSTPLPRDEARDFEFDTTDFTNDVTLSCPGSGSTPGHDAFFRLDVRAFDFWHFHLTAMDDGAARDPVLYLLQATGGICNVRTCAGLSDECTRLGDEHFGFRATEDGTWFLGVDDTQPGGGRYRLDVFRPACGDGTTGHGEGCDQSGQPCDAACRYRLAGDVVSETSAIVPPNTIGEALSLDLGPDGSIVVAGNADNDFTDDVDTCEYPDFFVVSVPQGGSVEVVLVDAANAACDAAADVVPVQMQLLRPTLQVAASSTPLPGTGCPRLRAMGLAEGQYFLTVTQTEERSMNELAYRLRVTVEG